MNEIAKKPRRWPLWALAVSIMLNLVMVGMLGGIMLRGGPDAGLIRAAIAALPDDARRALRRDSREAWRGPGAHAGTGNARAELLAALRAEEFDANGFRAGLGAARLRLIGMSERLEDRLVAELATLDADARRLVADRLERRTSRQSR
jgi:uncharacterized membrane protein